MSRFKTFLILLLAVLVIGVAFYLYQPNSVKLVSPDTEEADHLKAEGSWTFNDNVKLSHISTDESGNVYVEGFSNSNEENSGYFLSRLNSEGNIDWINTTNTKNKDTPASSSIVFSAENNSDFLYSVRKETSATSTQNWLEKYKADSGKKVWGKQLSSSSPSSLSVKGSKVYIGIGSYIESVDTQSGERKGLSLPGKVTQIQSFQDNIFIIGTTEDLDSLENPDSGEVTQGIYLVKTSSDLSEKEWERKFIPEKERASDIGYHHPFMFQLATSSDLYSMAEVRYLEPAMGPDLNKVDTRLLKFSTDNGDMTYNRKLYHPSGIVWGQKGTVTVIDGVVYGISGESKDRWRLRVAESIERSLQNPSSERFPGYDSSTTADPIYGFLDSSSVGENIYVVNGSNQVLNYSTETWFDF